MRNFSLLAFGALALCLAGTAARAEAPLRVFTSSQTAPKTYLNHDRPTGYLVEITAEALHRAGYLPQVEALPWARAVAEAEAGEGLVTGFSRTVERDRLFDYSDVVYEDRVVLVTRRDADFPFASLDDLAGRSIGIQRGSSFGPELEAALDQFHVVRDNGHCERLRMLGAGRIDGAIVSGGVAGVSFNVATAGLDLHDLVIHATPVALDPNYIAIAKSRRDGPEILGRINLALAAMARDGTTRRLIAAYEVGAGL
jgi:polar amino acid transport system substrate-binding protein